MVVRRLAKAKIAGSIPVSRFLCVFGELAEWLKALVLKTSDPVRDRGFESHILRLA